MKTGTTDESKESGWPRTRLQWMLIIGAQWTIAIVGAVTVGVLIGLKDPEGFPSRMILPVSLLAAVALLSAMIFPITSLPGRLRARVLRNRLPDSLVVDVARSRELSAAILERSGEVLLRGASLAMVANPDGVSFWGGVRDPGLRARFGWEEVGAITVVDHSLRGIDVGRLEFAHLGAAKDVSFGLPPQRFFGFAPPSALDLEPIAIRLRAFRSEI